MDECKSGSCGMYSGMHKMGRAMHGFHEEMSGRCSCGCTSECSCGCGGGCNCSCCCNNMGGEHEKCMELMMLAKIAHKELLIEKMKAALEAKMGKKMDKIADIAVDAALSWMKNKMSERQAHAEFDEKLMDIFKNG